MTWFVGFDAQWMRNGSPRTVRDIRTPGVLGRGAPSASLLIPGYGKVLMSGTNMKAHNFFVMYYDSKHCFQLAYIYFG